MKYLVMADIHGKYEMFRQALLMRAQADKVLLLGDYVDRGEDGKSVLLRVQEEVEENGAIALKGNHEAMFLDFLDKPETRDYYVNVANGKVTVESLLYPGVFETHSYDTIVAKIYEHYEDLIRFIRELPTMFETDKFIFVHAGLNLELEDYHDTSEEDRLWIREPFHEGLNRTGKLIIFGHTPTPYLNGDPNNTAIWQTEDGKIGIDGGASQGGVLHVLLIDEDDENYTDFQIKPNENEQA
jgi:serine/threonine protein phosphatase 1